MDGEICSVLSGDLWCVEEIVDEIFYRTEPGRLIFEIQVLDLLTDNTFQFS